MAAIICERMAEGLSLLKICQMDGMPAMSSVFLWQVKHPEFSELYARAQLDRAQAFGEQILAVSDAKSSDMGAVQRDRLKVDTRKWLMSRMDPKRWGDRLTHTNADGGNLEMLILRSLEREKGEPGK
jgi:hypothetical protein